MRGWERRAPRSKPALLKTHVDHRCLVISGGGDSGLTLLRPFLTLPVPSSIIEYRVHMWPFMIKIMHMDWCTEYLNVSCLLKKKGVGICVYVCSNGDFQKDSWALYFDQTEWSMHSFQLMSISAHPLGALGQRCGFLGPCLMPSLLPSLALQVLIIHGQSGFAQLSF